MLHELHGRPIHTEMIHPAVMALETAACTDGSQRSYPSSMSTPKLGTRACISIPCVKCFDPQNSSRNNGVRTPVAKASACNARVRSAPVFMGGGTGFRGLGSLAACAPRPLAVLFWPRPGCWTGLAMGSGTVASQGKSEKSKTSQQPQRTMAGCGTGWGARCGAARVHVACLSWAACRHEVFLSTRTSGVHECNCIQNHTCTCWCCMNISIGEARIGGSDSLSEWRPLSFLHSF